MEKREISRTALCAAVALAVLLSVCAACPEPCECPRSHHVLCANRGLRHVPQPGPGAVPAARLLGLAGNFISNVTARDFFNYSHLTRLDLQFNQIHSLHPQAFVRLSELEELYLGHNLIAMIKPGTLEPLKKLTVLYGNSNNIKELVGETFRELQSVLKLRLDKNSIELLDESVFRYLPNLMFLHLEANQLHHIHRKAFSGLVKLQFLNLSNNKQKELRDIVMFSHLKSLVTLLLTSNQITYIGNHVFQNMEKLTKLSLSNNQIGRFEKEALRGLMRLRELTIDHNELTEIPEGLLEPLEHIERLDLSSNQISDINPSAFVRLVQLKVLNLSNNQLVRLPGGAFTSNTDLFQLDLSGNDWTCDCSIEKLKDWMVETHARGKLLTTLVQCRHPPALKGKYLDYVKHIELREEGNSSIYCQKDQEADIVESQEAVVVELAVLKEERPKRGGEKEESVKARDAKGGREKPARKRKKEFRPRSQTGASDLPKESPALALLGPLTTKVVPLTTESHTTWDQQTELNGAARNSETREHLNSLLQEEEEHYESSSMVVTEACHFNRHYILKVSVHNITSGTATISWSTATNLHAVHSKALMFRIQFDRFGHVIRFPRYVYTDGTTRAVVLQELLPDSTYITCVESIVGGAVCQVAPRDHCAGFITASTSVEHEVKLQHMTIALLMANALLLLLVGGVWLGRVLKRKIKKRKSSAHAHVRHMYSTRRPFRSAMATACVSSEFSGYQSGRPLAEEGDLIQFPADRFFGSSCSHRDDDTMMARFSD